MVDPGQGQRIMGDLKVILLPAAGVICSVCVARNILDVLYGGETQVNLGSRRRSLNT